MNSEAAQLSETPLATSIESDEPIVEAIPEPPLPETAPSVPVAETVAPESAESTEPAAPAAQNPRALLKTLQAQFPVFRDCLPLSIGIDKAIKAALPEVSKKALRIALSLHTHGNRYLRGMAKATQRFDLDGTPVGEVTDEHRQHATDTLRERMKKQADERRAAQKAEREQQKAEREQQKAEQPQPPEAAQKVEREHSKAKREQPKKAPAQAERKVPKAEREADAERVRAEKLALLAQKFARH